MVVTLSFRTNIPKGERKMPVQVPSKWDKEVDVVVLGTGGAALTAAIAAADGGASVLVLEKTHQIGGTTSYSGDVP